MIELKNVSKYYHQQDVTNLGLHNISVEFHKGEIVAITGDSGCGKSTLLNVITKIDTFDDGEIYFKGNETSYFSVSDMDDFRKNKIGFIFQNYNIIDSYTVLENVMLPLVLKGISTHDAKKRALELIEKVGLANRVKHRGTKLSGGEKQRCVIARALASDCEILACDEPTGNLDSVTGAEIIKLISEIAKDKLVLIVTHNFEQVKDIVTRKIRLTDGELTEDVVYKEIPKDENQPLDLDYIPLQKKICGKVAKNNVLFTPRKTLLLSVIFLAICFATLFLFQSIFASSDSETVQSVYYNEDEGRLVLYDGAHKAISKEKLSGYTLEENSFIEDHAAPVFMVPTDAVEGYSPQSVHYSDHKKINKLLLGAMPKTNSEVLLIVNPGFIKFSIDKSLIGSSIVCMNHSFIISGVAQSNDVKDVIVSQNTILRDLLTQEVLVNELKFYSMGSQKTINYMLFDENFDGIKIYVPKTEKIEALKAYAFDCYDITKNIQFEYSDELDFRMVYGSKLVSMDTYEISLYNVKNVEKEANKLGRMGFKVDVCKDTTNDSKITIFLSNLFAYIGMVSASTTLIIVFFITYVILSKVYQSKKKDYEILRTLGVTKKDMKSIVTFEVMGISEVVILFSFIAFVIMIHTIPKLHVLSNLKLTTVLIYLLVTTLFAWCLSRRFNRKLFKFSVSKSLKGDASRD